MFVQGEQLCPGGVGYNLKIWVNPPLPPLPPPPPPPPLPQLLSLSLSVRLPLLWPWLHRRHDSGEEPQWSWDSLSVFVRTVHRPTDWGQARPDMFGRDAAGWQPVRRPVSVSGERTWMWAAQPGEGEWFKRFDMSFIAIYGCQCVVFYPWGSCSCDFFNISRRDLYLFLAVLFEFLRKSNIKKSLSV